MACCLNQFDALYEIVKGAWDCCGAQLDPDLEPSRCDSPEELWIKWGCITRDCACDVVDPVVCFPPETPVVNPPNFLLGVDNQFCAVFTDPAFYALAALNINTLADSGLSGGGNLTLDRNLELDIDNLVNAGPLNDGDLLAISQGGAEANVSLATFSSFLSQDFVPTTRNINTLGGSGLAGGGDLTADRDLELDIDNLPVSGALAATNQLPVSQAGAESRTDLGTMAAFINSSTPYPLFIIQSDFSDPDVDAGETYSVSHNFVDAGTYFISICLKSSAGGIFPLLRTKLSPDNNQILIQDLQSTVGVDPETHATLSYMKEFAVGVQEIAFVEHIGPNNSDHLLCYEIWRLK